MMERTMTRLNIPNLDAMSPTSLLTWRDSLQSKSLTAAQATRYATLKERAMRNRLAGNISAALACEQECDAIYQRMPKAYRW